MPFPSSATSLSLLGVQRSFPIVFPRLSISTSCRALLRNGSTGGNLEDVRLKKILVAGIDPLALDA
jgi:hypothetical protein